MGEKSPYYTNSVGEITLFSNNYLGHVENEFNSKLNEQIPQLSVIAGEFCLFNLLLKYVILYSFRWHAIDLFQFIYC